MAVVVNELKPEDYKAWLALWDANNLSHKNDALAQVTWHRILTPASPVGGLVAREDDKLVGLVHYILHPVTGHVEPVAYMQDLYVEPAYRRRGIGRALVEKLVAVGKGERWARIYWLAEQKNPEAQALYSKLGVKLDFSLHVLPLT